MKEYIERISRGNIKYKRPVMNLSETAINKTCPVNSIFSDKFIISADSVVKGVIYSTNELVGIDAAGSTLAGNNQVKCTQSAGFSGKENQVNFVVNTNGICAGHIIKGEFDIVSDAGQKSISYTFEVTNPVVETSNGPIGTLQEFTGLFREYPHEAARLFISDDFRRIFISDDMVARNRYDVYASNSNTIQAVEEFLSVMGKKNEVKIEVDKTDYKYSQINKDYAENIKISKTSWGFVDIDIRTDSEFIRPDIHHLNSDMFTGNIFELRFLICKEKLHAGKNLGRIYIDTASQHFVINIEASYSSCNNDDRERKQALRKLTGYYLDYRLKKTDMNDWIEKSNKVLDHARGIYTDDVYLKLVQAQIYAIQGRTDDGMWLVSSVRDIIEAQQENNVELYCFYLYVNSLYLKNDDFTAQVVKILKKYYETGHDNWRMLWMLFYTDETQNRNLSIKLTRIKDAFHNGCTSPVMYFEAMNIINQQPLLLRVLNDFEVQVLNFGCRYALIDKRLAHHICDIISSTKVASVRILGILNSLYEQLDDDVILSALVTHMIRNELVGENCVKLYETGILRGLKITRLYEFYILSLNKTRMNKLPKMVLMYFVFENQLEVYSKSYLYANVIITCRDDEKIMEMYNDQIEKFGYEHMINSDISEFLLIIYKYILDKNIRDDALDDFIKKLMFTYKITCSNKDIEYVKIKHKELNKAVKYRLVKGITFVQMYTKDCCVAFSKDDVEYRNTGVMYEIERVYQNDDYLDEICRKQSDDFYIRLYMNEKYTQQNNISSDMLNNCLSFINDRNVNRDFIAGINSWLIYNDNDDYASINKDGLNIRDAAKLTQKCIANDMYDEAAKLIKKYGFEQIKPSALFKFARNRIYNMGSVVIEDELLVQICGYIFKMDKYDGVILKYMSDFYNNTNELMYELWKACINYEIDADSLTGRLIGQMLFTAQYGKSINELFKSYYSRGYDDTIISAYIVMAAYLYFANDYEYSDYVFDALEKRVLNDEHALEICRIALLKYYSQKPGELFKESVRDTDAKNLSEKRAVAAQKILDDLCGKNKIFSFYQKFNGFLSIPYNAIDKTVVEYKADDESKVVIYYKVSGSDKYESEDMKCTAGGIFTKTFTLFYSDSITYYIVAEKGGDSIKTNENTITFDMNMLNNTEGRFASINKMLKSMDEHDVTTVRKLMHAYAVNDYVASQIFTTMD